VCSECDGEGSSTYLTEEGTCVELKVRGRGGISDAGWACNCMVLCGQ